MCLKKDFPYNESSASRQRNRSSGNRNSDSIQSKTPKDVGRTMEKGAR